MKEKLNGLLERKVNLEQTITACMVTFLAAVVLFVVWGLLLTGSWGNLVNSVKFGQILSVIDRVYIGQADTQQLADQVYDTMIESLGDRWSFYMTREEYQRYQQVQSNCYTGVGITLMKKEQDWEIVEVSENSPAYEAGVPVGGYLVQVNGVDAGELESGEISAKMRENPDHIQLVVELPDGSREAFEMAMEVIYSNPVSYEMKPGQIGYIRLENFDETCAKEAIAAVDALMEQQAQALVFDVRNNGGGYVSELCELLDHLLPEGEIFVSVDHSGTETVTRSDKQWVDLPMAVLVNENSYSAAEFFAAALDEYDAATVVGSRTTGKNRSQTNLILADGSAVHISSKQYLTPQRVDLTQQGGLQPDVELGNQTGDEQLDAALALFR